MKIKSLLVSVILFVIIILFPKTANAVIYDLIAPTGQFQRGQEVQFTINIDTEGRNLTNAIIGMTYVTNLLQYISTSPGDSFPNIQVETQEGGRLVFRASNQNGFSGTGTFATVTFKIIASSPGETELCVLFNPEQTPTSVPRPTELPKSGYTQQSNKSLFFGTIFILTAAGIIIFFNFRPYLQNKYSNPSKHKHIPKIK